MAVISNRRLQIPPRGTHAARFDPMPVRGTSLQGGTGFSGTGSAGVTGVLYL